MDIMYISRIPLIVMTSSAIHFGVVEMIKDEKKAAIIKSLQQAINTYQTYTHRQAIWMHHKTDGDNGHNSEHNSPL